MSEEAETLGRGDSAADPTDARIYRVLVFIGLLLVFGGLAVAVLRPFTSALVWAAVLAIAFRAPWAWVVRRLPRRRSLAAATAAALVALVVLLPVILVVSVLAGEAARTAGWVAAEAKAKNISSVADLGALPGVARALSWLDAHSGLKPADVEAKFSDFLAGASTFVAERSAAFLVGVLDTVLTFAMTMFVLFFFFRDGDDILERVTTLIPLQDAERREAIESLKRLLEAVFRGSLLCALIQGFTGGVGWAIAGLPSPFLAGAVMTVLSLLPIGGTAIVWLPGCLVAWSQGRHGAAVFLFVWGAIVTSFLADNVLKPILMRGSGELETLLVFLGVFGGLAAFGPLGLFVGPVALAVTKTLLQVLARQAERARACSIPEETAVVPVPPG